MIKYTEYKLNNNNNVSFNAGKLPDTSALKSDRFLKRLSETMSLSQYQDTFNQYMTLNPTAVRVHENLIKDNDLYYKAEFLLDSKLSEQILTFLNRRGFTIVPQFVKSSTNNIGYSVTMTKIPGAMKGNLLSYSESRRAVPLSAKHNAYKELLELLKLDIVNIDILNNPEILKVVKGAQTRIVCEDWSNLCTTNEYLMNFAPDKDYFYLVNKLYDIIYGK